MNTQYTQGFKAGMVWREAEIIKILKGYEVEVVIPVDFAIALIKGEK